MKTLVAVLTSILLIFVCLVVLAQAEVAGRITQVEGTVDFLKGGKLPASAVKLDDNVEVGDVLRTKSLSKAQITFMDNTVITISPESRIAIEEYMFDPKGKRSAVLQLFQGLAHVVVSKLFKVSEPDFVVKTQTAVMGVRGTDVGLRIHPNNTTILNFEGHTEVGNLFPEVGDLLFKKAYKTAFSWGHATVHLHNMQGTSVFRGLPPTQPFTVDQGMKDQFMGQVSSGLTGQKGTKTGTQAAAGGTSGSGSSSGGGSGSGDTGGGGTGTSDSGTSSNLTSASLGGPDSGTGSSLGSTSTLSTLPTSVTTPTTSGIAGTGLTANQVITNTIISPPNNPTPTPTPTPEPVTPNFSETLSGPYSLTSTSPFTTGIFTSTSPASGTRTGSNPGPVTANFNFNAIWTNGGNTWNPSYNGTFTTTISGSTVTGTLDVTLLDSPAGKWTGTAVPFTVDSAGNLIFSLASLKGVAFPLNDPLTVTSGTFTQTPVTTPTPTPSTYNFTLSANSQFTSSATSSSTYSTTASGWAAGEGTWTSSPLYYTSSSTSNKTTLQGTNLTGSAIGSSTGTLSGTVTGIQGQTLTGTGTFRGTDSYGFTSNETGTITVAPSGQLTFTYANGTLSGQYRLASSSGTITFTPGTYIQQSTDGATLSTSTSPYNTATITSTGLWAGGSRTGVLPGSFDLAFSGTETSAWKYSYMGNELSDVTATMQGVVSPTGSGGYQGAMSISPNNQDTPFTSSLLPQFQPSPYQFLGENGTNSLPMVSTITINPDGSASGSLYRNEYQDGKWATSNYTLNQTVPSTSLSTPISATYNFQESYNGAMMLGNSSNLGNAYGSGWGQRSFNGTGSTAATSIYNSYFASWDNGTWTATSGSLPGYYGSSLAPGSGGPGVAMLTGSMSGILGKTLSGSMTFVGSLLNGASFHYSGPATMDSSGYITFNYQNGGGYTSGWVYPGGASGTATGTINQAPGYYFTQTMTGNSYSISSSNPSSATFTVSSNSTTSGSRTGIFGGTTGPFNGNFSLYFPNQDAPTGTTTGTVTNLSLEGVAYDQVNGGTSGIASLQVDSSSFSTTIPGTVNLSPGGSGFAGGTLFIPAPVFVQTNSPYSVQIQNYGNTLSSLTQGTSWSFTESYNGFRTSTLANTPYLASTEGYGWTKFTASNLPSTSYLGTGYGLIQNLGTLASASSLSSNTLGVNGTISGILSGVNGQSLSGQATFTGTNSSGVTFTYQGNVVMAPNGQLVFSYGGSWTTPSGQTGTGSGSIQQVPGTYFTEVVTGQYTQVANSSSGVNNLATTGQVNMTGTRIMDPGGANTTTSTVGSLATLNSSTVNSFTPTSGTASVTVQGVVAGSSWQTRWGVATTTPTYTASGGSPTTIAGTTGPVTIDPAGTLTTQSVGTIANAGNTPDTISRNLISVPAASGQNVYGYAQTASGAFSQAATSDGSGKTVTANLTGISTGVLTGNTSANVNITSTAMNPSSYISGSGNMTINSVGVLAGQPGGVLTGVSTHHGVRTINETTRTPVYVGSTTLTPGSGSTPATLATNLFGVNRTVGGGAGQVGTLVVTPR